MKARGEGRGAEGWSRTFAAVRIRLGNSDDIGAEEARLPCARLLQVRDETQRRRLQVIARARRRSWRRVPSPAGVARPRVAGRVARQPVHERGEVAREAEVWVAGEAREQQLQREAPLRLVRGVV